MYLDDIMEIWNNVIVSRLLQGNLLDNKHKNVL